MFGAESQSIDGWTLIIGFGIFMEIVDRKKKNIQKQFNNIINLPPAFLKIKLILCWIFIQNKILVFLAVQQNDKL